MQVSSTNVHHCWPWDHGPSRAVSYCIGVRRRSTALSAQPVHVGGASDFPRWPRVRGVPCAVPANCLGSVRSPCLELHSAEFGSVRNSWSCSRHEPCWLRRPRAPRGGWVLALPLWWPSLFPWRDPDWSGWTIVLVVLEHGPVGLLRRHRSVRLVEPSPTRSARS
jgi:hypothetical protein